MELKTKELTKKQDEKNETYKVVYNNKEYTILVKHGNENKETVFKNFLFT